MRTDFRNGLLDRIEAMDLVLRELYTDYGYRPYKMSKFEPYDLYLENRSFVTGGSILTFTDTDGRLMALKPDVTLSVIKNYRGGQQKVCYSENVYRDTGSSNEFREIPQAGLECIGEIDLYTQLEVLTLAAESLKRISPEALLDVASAEIVQGLLEAAPVSREERDALLHLLHEKNAHGMSEVCEKAGLPAQAASLWQYLAALYGPANTALPELHRRCLGDRMRAAVEELSALCALLSDTGVPVQLDFSILQDIHYYNGLVFRGYVPGVHAAVLSGGRYDHLLKKLGKHGQAIGFAVYLDMLTQLPGDEKPLDADVLLHYGPEDDPAAVMQRARQLRREGKRVLVQRQQTDARCGETLQMGGENHA